MNHYRQNLAAQVRHCRGNPCLWCPSCGTDLARPDLPYEIEGARAQPPLLLETSRPGIFCIGDVRSGSIKRTATAIGEGSMAVRLVFDRLQTTGLAVAAPPTVDAAS
jgi:hypothetical protein